MRVGAVLECVINQVAHAAAQGQGFAVIRTGRSPLQRYPAIPLRQHIGFYQTVEQSIDVDQLDILVNVGVFHALQRAFDQHFQLVQIATKLVLQLLVIQQFHAQTQPGDGRAQVMGDGAE